MATAVLGMTLSQHVAVFYVTNVTYGFQRSALLSVPFIIVNDCILSQVGCLCKSFPCVYRLEITVPVGWMLHTDN